MAKNACLKKIFQTGISVHNIIKRLIRQQNRRCHRRYQFGMGKAVSILIAEPPEAAFFHRPIETGIPVAVEQISAPSAEPGLVAGDDHGLFVADGGEQGGEYQGIGFGVDFGADNQVAAKIGGGLLAARRFGCPYLIIGGQVKALPLSPCGSPSKMPPLSAGVRGSTCVLLCEVSF